MKDFLGGGNVVSTSTINTAGCMDINTVGYDPSANIQQTAPCPQCVFGCMNSGAANYDANATCEGDSNDPSTFHVLNAGCIWHVSGCTDPQAFNYDPLATQCLAPGCSCIPVISGCTDPDALNFDCDPSLTPNSSFLGQGGILTSSCGHNVNTQNNPSTCIPKLFGCTNQAAANYNSNANVDDNSCTFPAYPCGYVGVTTSFPWIIISFSNITHNSVEIDWGSPDAPDTQSSSTATWNNLTTITSFDLEFKESSSTTYTTYSTGVSFPITVTGLQPQTTYDFRLVVSCSYLGSNQNITTTTPGYSYPAQSGASDYSEQVTTTAIIPVPGCTDPQAINHDCATAINQNSLVPCNDGVNTDDGSCHYIGCMHPPALNYNQQATLQCGDTDQTTLGTPGGCCTYAPIYGCTDPAYLEYYGANNPNLPVGSTSVMGSLWTACDSTDPNQQNLWPTCGTNPLYPPGPNCCCTTLQIFGCTDPLATNYDPNANQPCDTPQSQLNAGVPCAPCTFPPQTVLGCTDSTPGPNPSTTNPAANWNCGGGENVGVEVLFGIGGQGPPLTFGACQILGFTGFLATNYNTAATNNDPNNPCTYETYGCTNSVQACNFDVNNTQDPFNECISECTNPTNVVVSQGTDPTKDVTIAFDQGTTPELTAAGIDCILRTVIEFKPTGSPAAYQILSNNAVNGAQYDLQAISGLGLPLPEFEFTVKNICDNIAETSSPAMFGGTYTPIAPVIPGCTNQQATNYDPLATIDDGSCVLANTGCMDNAASNYSNTYNTPCSNCCVYNGCTDPLALNFSFVGENVTQSGDPYLLGTALDDGSCQYCPDLFATTNQSSLLPADGNPSVKPTVSATQPTTNGRLTLTSSYASQGGNAVGLKFSFGNILDSSAIPSPSSSTIHVDPNWTNKGIVDLSVMLSETPIADPSSGNWSGHGSGNGVANLGGWVSTRARTSVGGKNGNIQLGGLKGSQQYYVYTMAHCRGPLTSNTVGVWNNQQTGVPQYSTISTSPISFTTYPIEGCTDPTATNFNSNATVDNGSCVFPPSGQVTAEDYMGIQNFDFGNDNSLGDFYRVMSYNQTNDKRRAYGVTFNFTAPQSATPCLSGCTQANHWPNVVNYNLGAIDVGSWISGDTTNSHMLPTILAALEGGDSTTGFTAAMYRATTPALTNQIWNGQTWDYAQGNDPWFNNSAPFPFKTNKITHTANYEYAFKNKLWNHHSLSSGIKSPASQNNNVIQKFNPTTLPNGGSGGFIGRNANLGADGVWSIGNTTLTNHQDQLFNFIPYVGGTGGDYTRASATYYCVEPNGNPSTNSALSFDNTVSNVDFPSRCKGIWPYPAPCKNDINPTYYIHGLRKDKPVVWSNPGGGAAEAHFIFNLHISTGCHWGKWRFNNMKLRFTGANSPASPGYTQITIGDIDISFHPEHWIDVDPNFTDINTLDFSITSSSYGARTRIANSANNSTSPYVTQAISFVNPSGNNGTGFGNLYFNRKCKQNQVNYNNQLFQNVQQDPGNVYHKDWNGNPVQSGNNSCFPLNAPDRGGCYMEVPILIPVKAFADNPDSLLPPAVTNPSFTFNTSIGTNVLNAWFLSTGPSAANGFSRRQEIFNTLVTSSQSPRYTRIGNGLRTSATPGRGMFVTCWAGSDIATAGVGSQGANNDWHRFLQINPNNQN